MLRKRRQKAKAEQSARDVTCHPCSRVRDGLCGNKNAGNKRKPEANENPLPVDRFKNKGPMEGEVNQSDSRGKGFLVLTDTWRLINTPGNETVKRPGESKRGVAVPRKTDPGSWVLGFRSYQSYLQGNSDHHSK